MAELLTESFCERCGTRYTFEAAGRKRAPLAKIRVFSRGFKHYIQNDDASFNDALAEARTEQGREVSTQQLDAFHETFNFCLNCRQYTCPNCWNEPEGRCLSCSPNLGREILPAPFPVLSEAAPTAALTTPPAPVAEVAPVAPLAPLAPVAPLAAEPAPWPETPLPAWPSGLTAAPTPDTTLPPVGSETGTPQPVLSPGAWPTIDLSRATAGPPSAPVLSPEPFPVIAPEPPAAPIAPEPDTTTPVTAEDEGPSTPDDDWLAATRRLVMVTPEVPDGDAGGEDGGPIAPATDADRRRSAAAAAAGTAATSSLFSRFRATRPAQANGSAGPETSSDAEAPAADEAPVVESPMPDVEPVMPVAASLPVVEPVMPDAEPVMPDAEPVMPVAASLPVVEPPMPDVEPPIPTAAQAAAIEPFAPVEPLPVAAVVQQPPPEVAPASLPVAPTPPAFVPEPLPEPPAKPAPMVTAAAWQMVAPETPSAAASMPAALNGAPQAQAVVPQEPPSWPTSPAPPPSWPASSGANGSTDESNLWIASSRDVLARPGSGVQACVRCGLPLSSTARFCRRCGSRQE